MLDATDDGDGDGKQHSYRTKNPFNSSASSIECLVATKKLFVSFVVAKLAWNINTFDADDITLLLQSTNTNIMMVSKFVST